MRTQPRDIRCKTCGILLGRLDESGLTIRRGDLQATMDGEFRASLVCYRRSCGALNVVRVPDRHAPTALAS